MKEVKKIKMQLIVLCYLSTTARISLFQGFFLASLKIAGISTGFFLSEPLHLNWPHYPASFWLHA